MFDVFGQAIDRLPAPTGVQWRSVHRAPPPLAKRSTQSEIFETGIKVIDVLLPLERGGKAGLLGGAGVGKTVLLRGWATSPPWAPSYRGWKIALPTPTAPAPAGRGLAAQVNGHSLANPQFAGGHE